MTIKLAPSIKFCPYCGSKNLKYWSGTTRCMECRAVFFNIFSRYMRKASKKKDGDK